MHCRVRAIVNLPKLLPSVGENHCLPLPMPACSALASRLSQQSRAKVAGQPTHAAQALAVARPHGGLLASMQRLQQLLSDDSEARPPSSPTLSTGSSASSPGGSPASTASPGGVGALGGIHKQPPLAAQKAGSHGMGGSCGSRQIDAERALTADLVELADGALASPHPNRVGSSCSLGTTAAGRWAMPQEQGTAQPPGCRPSFFRKWLETVEGDEDEAGGQGSALA